MLLLSRRIIGKTLTTARKRVFASTVIRKGKDKEITGFLFELEWPAGKIVKRIPVPVGQSDYLWGGRGGNRGGRGLFWYDGFLFMATARSILKYSSDLELVTEITNDRLAGIHEILVDGQGIWCTSTVHDLAIKIGFNGETLDEWYGCQSKTLQERFQVDTRPVNFSFIEDGSYEEYIKLEKLHINSVTSLNGDLFVFCNNINAMIKIRPEPVEVILHDSKLERSAHNCIFSSDDEVILNDTFGQNIKIYQSANGSVDRVISTGRDTNSPSIQFARPGWQRGLSKYEDQIYLVGTSPASIFEVDVNSGKLGRTIVLDRDVKHCIHGLLVVDNMDEQGGDKNSVWQ